MSRRQDILETVRTRLQDILKANGYNTDAGEQVFLGEAPQLGVNDPDQAISMVVGDEELDDRQRQELGLFIVLPIDVVVLANATLAEPWVILEEAIADVKRAMETGDRQLDGLLHTYFVRRGIRTLPRETGSAVVGAAVPYLFPFKDSYGGA